MKEDDRPAAPWFPAKTYGWGWGPPHVWQGWAVLAAFFALLGLGIVLFPLPGEMMAFLAYTFALTAMLLAICWIKGERPRWGGEGK